jgi:hypothetical protein
MLDPSVPAWHAKSPEVVRAMVSAKLIGSMGMQSQLLHTERLISARPDPGYSYVFERKQSGTEAFTRWLVVWQANLEYLEDGARSDLKLRSLSDDWDRIFSRYTVSTVIWLSAIISIWFAEPGIAELHLMLAVAVSIASMPAAAVLNLEASTPRESVKIILLALLPSLAGIAVVGVAVQFYPSTGLLRGLVLTLLVLLTSAISARMSYVGLRSMWNYGLGRHGNVAQLWKSQSDKG